jgi:two-component system, cell cycle response regulator
VAKKSIYRNTTGRFYNNVMSDSASSSNPLPSRRLETVQLVGFSSRDGELFKLFLRRPPGAGASLQVVESNADLLIANMTTLGAREAVAARADAPTTIGIVTRYATDAPFYQVLQDSQLLYALAQAINRLREGWDPTPSETSLSAKSDAELTARTINVGLSAATSGETVTPSVPAPAPQPIAAPAGLPWQRQLCILVVDDSKFSRLAVAEALQRVGFIVDTAVDGEDGMRMARLKRYDVAVVDFEMPGMRGPEVIRKMGGLKATAPQVLIMLTSRTGPVDRLRARVAGCDAYLTKPTKMSEFISVLKQCVASGKLTHQ